MRQQPDPRTKALPIGGLLLLCLIWAWDSLRADLFPGPSEGIHLPTLLVAAIVPGIFALLAGTGALIGKAARPRGPELRSAVLVGLGLFVLPDLLTEWSNGWIGAPTRVALFSLTPLFAVVFEPYIGDQNAPAMRHAFAAALVAVAGTLLVFSIDIPRSAASGLAFLAIMVAAASVAAANCVAVRILTMASRGLQSGFAAASAGTAALSFAVLATFRTRLPAPLNAWAILDLLALILLFWLMGRMSAVRMTTRFLIAPLIANLVAIAFLRPHVNARGWVGLALIASGSGWLLLARDSGPELTGSSLQIH